MQKEHHQTRSGLFTYFLQQHLLYSQYLSIYFILPLPIVHAFKFKTSLLYLLDNFAVLLETKHRWYGKFLQMMPFF